MTQPRRLLGNVVSAGRGCPGGWCGNYPKEDFRFNYRNARVESDLDLEESGHRPELLDGDKEIQKVPPFPQTCPLESYREKNFSEQ